jgi:CRISPR/Cas system-associated exonuclease Cas4 (RecB family)
MEMRSRNKDLFILSLISAFHDKSLAASPTRLNRRINELLRLWKIKRGVSESQLVFIGMANVANYYWCAVKSLLRSKGNEIEFFTAYLSDRISYSFELGLTSDMPTSVDGLLTVGEGIEFSDIERLLRKKAGDHKRLITGAVEDKDGKEVMVINPDIPAELKEELKEDAKVRGIHVIDLEEYPMLRGMLIEGTRGEDYPSIRWNFKWGNYVVVGMPDGITDAFVYEFKTTRNEFLKRYIKPVALIQADLYGYFFKRGKKRVQIHIMEENRTETWEEDVDKANAMRMLSSFERVDKGEKPLPPKEWKCKSCELRVMCEKLRMRSS